MGPDGSDNKLIHQVTPHKVLEPAQLAKTTQEIWPGLQNKLMCDSSPCLKTSSYSLSVSIPADVVHEEQVLAALKYNCEYLKEISKTIETLEGKC